MQLAVDLRNAQRRSRGSRPPREIVGSAAAAERHPLDGVIEPGAYDAAVDTLSVFNRKAEKLNGLRFMASVRDNKLNYEILFSSDGPVITRNLPESEETDAFLLTFRLFLQSNDRVSVRRIAELYDQLPVTPDLRARVEAIKRQINDYLDGLGAVVFKTGRVTRREIVDVFLHGDLGHTDAEKGSTLRAWLRDPVIGVQMEMEFHLALASITQAVFWLRQCNLEAISQLQAL